MFRAGLEPESPTKPALRLDRAQGSGLAVYQTAESLATGRLSDIAGITYQVSFVVYQAIPRYKINFARRPGLQAWAGLDAGSGSGLGNVEPKPDKAQPKPGLSSPARP
ncbi:hypothetical protein FB45DRAFT_876494 [Roridomyces roridus]|uniref:Uncharacterized protein n=1 Tax=Roridomyces roridus TaxID=1738132 RepID=A0AAD7FB20_9AGAR|nr:hypothetical protein FB45DRAFT_876494 [Roridomyces roridus]